jgi:acyl-CoA reductase-like NAD-dependent aldehyde dehydrogenase
MGKALQSVNPRTGEVVGEAIPETSTEEVAAKAEAAREAAPGFAALSPRERGDIMRAIAAALRENEAVIVETVDSETALGEVRLKGELARTCGQFELYAASAEEGSQLDVTINHADPAATPPKPDLRRHNVAIGPVAVYAASNFPLGFGVAGTDTAAAFAAGCPVVAKSLSAQPATAKLLGEIVVAALEKHGADPRLFSVVFGTRAGVDLIRHPAIKAGAFTGSVSGGRALFNEAAARPDPVPFYGELGSLNPVVVTPEAVAARGESLIDDFAASMTMGTGQFCTKPGLLFLPEGHGLDAKLAEAVGAKDVHPMLNRRIWDAYSSGAKALAAHDQAEFLLEPTDTGVGFGVTPGLVKAPAAALDGDDTLLEECFGPAALVLTYRDADELLRVLPQLPGGLTGTVHIDRDDDPVAVAVMPLLAELSGRVIVNGWPTGVAVVHAMHHGGPWPATTNSLYTSVGTGAIRRFLRPVSHQSVPEALLPEAVREDNPLGVPRRVDGVLHAAP